MASFPERRSLRKRERSVFPLCSGVCGRLWVRRLCYESHCLSVSSTQSDQTLTPPHTPPAHIPGNNTSQINLPVKHSQLYSVTHGRELEHTQTELTNTWRVHHHHHHHHPPDHYLNLKIELLIPLRVCILLYDLCGQLDVMSESMSNADRRVSVWYQGSYTFYIWKFQTCSD